MHRRLIWRFQNGLVSFARSSKFVFTTNIHLDEYDYLEKQVDLLLSGKVAKPKSSGKGKKGKGSAKSSSKGSKKSKDSKKSKGSKESKGKKKKAKPLLPTLKGIPEDLLYEILQQKLATFETGVVIESLNSKFMNRPFMVLNNLLKAIGNVRHIQFIVLSFTLQEYIAREAELKIIQEIHDKEAKEETLYKFSVMSSDEICQLSPEEYIIFKEYLLNRKQRSLLLQETVK